MGICRRQFGGGLKARAEGRTSTPGNRKSFAGHRKSFAASVEAIQAVSAPTFLALSFFLNRVALNPTCHGDLNDCFEAAYGAL